MTTIRLRNAARYYRQLPHQQAALDWLETTLTPAQLTEFAKLYRAEPPAPKVEPYLLMRPTGRLDQFGGVLFSLSKTVDGKPVDAVLAISGAPGKTAVPVSHDYSGSMRPCPQGRFKLGGVERGAWGAAIGNIWISVYGTEPRQAIGIHSDANRGQAPGSAGCVCPLTDADMEQVARWRQEGIDILVVDHGFT